jgi:hypothetical protein
MVVSRQWPDNIIDHSSAACQCSSRIPPALSFMFTPASSFEIGKSSTFTCRDQPPSWTRRCAVEKECQNSGTEPWSVDGGLKPSLSLWLYANSRMRLTWLGSGVCRLVWSTYHIHLSWLEVVRG